MQQLSFFATRQPWNSSATAKFARCPPRNFSTIVLNMHLLQFIALCGPRSCFLISRLFDAVNCVPVYFSLFRGICCCCLSNTIYELCRSESGELVSCKYLPCVWTGEGMGTMELRMIVLLFCAVWGDWKRGYGDRVEMNSCSGVFARE